MINTSNYPEAKIFTAEDFKIEKRPRESNKGDYGKVRIVAGSGEMPGAALLSCAAAKAALRSGAGLVTLCAPESMKAAYQARALEYTLRFIPDRGGKIVFSEEAASAIADGADAIAMGMGLGNNAEINKFIRYFFQMTNDKGQGTNQITNYNLTAEPSLRAERSEAWQSRPYNKKIPRQYEGAGVLADGAAEQQTSTPTFTPHSTLHTPHSDNTSQSSILNSQFPTIVLDADALNALSADMGILREPRNAKVILTPHAAEFCRLWNGKNSRQWTVDSGQLKDADNQLPTFNFQLSTFILKTNPIYYAKAFAAEFDVVLVLKGADTVITDGKGIIINTAGTPALAKGGSGDLLSGVAAAFACRYPPLTAAAYACYILGTAAEKAALDFGENSLLASDIPDYIRF